MRVIALFAAFVAMAMSAVILLVCAVLVMSGLVTVSEETFRSLTLGFVLMAGSFAVAREARGFLGKE